MSLGKIQAGAAAIAVLLEDDQFKKDWAQLRSNMSKINRTLLGVGAAAGATGAAIGGVFYGIVRSAMAAESGFQRFALIFNESAGEMRKSLEGLAQTTGISMTTLIRQSSAFGAILGELRTALGPNEFVAIVGKTQKAVIDLVGLGVPLNDAAARVKSALTSTGEAVDQFGWNLRQAEIQQALTTLGIKKNLRQLTELEKQLVKIHLIEKAVRDGNLDFINTLVTLESKIAVFTSQLEEFYKSLSALILPILKTVVVVGTALLRFLNAPVIRPVVAIFGVLVALFGTLVSLIGATALGLAGLIAAFTWTTSTLMGLNATLTTANTNLIAMKLHVLNLTWQFKGLTLWIARAAAAIRTMAAALFANPLVGLGAAITGGIIGGAVLSQTAGRGGGRSLEQRLKDNLEGLDNPKNYIPGGGIDRFSHVRDAQRRFIKSQLFQEQMKDMAAPMPVAASGILGTRMIGQQLAYATGGGTASEQTAKNTSFLAKIARQVVGGEEKVHTETQS